MKKSTFYTTLLLALAYTISYVTRINYGAVISEMTRDTGISKSLLSLALTGSFITYGAGQVVSGVCGDRFQPKRLIFGGLAVSIFMNLLIPLCRSPYQMLAVWCVNGFAQAFMWPPIVRLMVGLFTLDEYKRMSIFVSWGSCVGTIFIYLVSPAIIALAGWRSVFLFSAVCGIVMLIVWQKRCPLLPEEKPKTEKSGSRSGLLSPLMLILFAAAIFEGSLKDGVATWMPSYIAETYNISNLISILTGVVLPLFSMLSYEITTIVHSKWLKDAMLCSAVIFSAGALAALLLFASTGKNAVFSVVLSALLNSCMHGIGLMVTCIIPAYFAKYGNAAKVSGFINAFIYVGSAASTYGTAVIAEHAGWSTTVLVWFFIAAAGALLMFADIPAWRRFTQK